VERLAGKTCRSPARGNDADGFNHFRSE
jgi:hypothetical protein